MLTSLIHDSSSHSLRRNGLLTREATRLDVLAGALKRDATIVDPLLLVLLALQLEMVAIVAFAEVACTAIVLFTRVDYSTIHEVACFLTHAGGWPVQR